MPPVAAAIAAGTASTAAQDAPSAPPVRREATAKRPEPAAAPEPVRPSERRDFKASVANDEQRSAAVRADALLTRRSSRRTLVIGGVVAAAWALLAGAASFAFISSGSSPVPEG